MADPFIGEIRMFGGNFAPVDWMFCEGQSIPISEYEVLFNLIGTTYGGGRPVDLQPAGPARAHPAPPVPEAGRHQTTPWPKPAAPKRLVLSSGQIPAHTHAGPGVVQSRPRLGSFRFPLRGASRISPPSTTPTRARTSPRMPRATPAATSPRKHAALPVRELLICMNGIFPSQN
jgi:microcystin-dependent protein